MYTGVHPDVLLKSNTHCKCSARWGRWFLKFNLSNLISCKARCKVLGGYNKLWLSSLISTNSQVCKQTIFLISRFIYESILSILPNQKKKCLAFAKHLLMVEMSGLEPPTPTLSGWCSNLLSYISINKWWR